ncbi:hypothetical protein [Bradyrhizobium phage BDU-MI-1]|nr:hypothetical protein [Bradyrhizobium phage BDU-MI-1]
MITFQKFITRSDLRANPDKVYVFGDNVQRSGLGGQAKEMRGEPNAIGVVTKWAPSLAPRAFFDDTAACKMLVERDLLKVQQALDHGKTVVVPTDGIGTGLARLHIVAPNLDRFIKDWFKGRASTKTEITWRRSA